MQTVSASRRFSAKVLLGAAALLLVSCGRTNTLEGSLTEILDLTFAEVEIQRATDAVVIAYTRPQGDGKDTVFRLVVKATAPVAETELQLGTGEGLVEASASRAVVDDPVRNFPPIRRGTVLFDSEPGVGSATSGEFRVTFGDGGDAGKGTTVFGTFTVASVATGAAI